MTIAKPFCASFFAIANPIPVALPAPVTKATFSLVLFIIMPVILFLSTSRRESGCFNPAVLDMPPRLRVIPWEWETSREIYHR
jgi:hypothetical protein